MSESDTYLKIDTRYTAFYTFLVQKGLKSIFSFQIDIFNLKIAFDCGTPAKQDAFQRHRESKNSEIHPCKCKSRTFYRCFM